LLDPVNIFQTIATININSNAKLLFISNLANGMILIKSVKM